jgi:hypothetical protein
VPDALEIVPGRSIGAVVLGMTRDEVRALGPHRDLEDGTGVFLPSGGPPDAREGITASFGSDGLCDRIEAFYASGPPLFRLRDRVVNGLGAENVEALFREYSPEIRRSYGSIEAPAAGISGVKWEAGDFDLCAIDVFPPAT